MTMGLQRHVRTPFEKYIQPWFANRPCRYLELGAYAGGTARYMLENVLLHPESRCDLVDPWEAYEAEPKSDGSPRVYDRENMRTAAERVMQLRSEYANKCRVFPMSSAEFLAGHVDRAYDLVFVDGLHTHAGVLADALGAFAILEIGGLIAFDDYNQKDVRDAVVEFEQTASKTALVAEFYHSKHQRCLRLWKTEQ